MVDEFSSDQEQVEAIKKWLKTHGPSIIIGIVVGLAAIAGWRFWGQYQDRQAEQASDFYAAVVDALADDDLAKANGQTVVLRNDYSGSAYAVLASLTLAKQAVDDSDNDAAIQHLQWIIDSTEQPQFTAIARLRLARVLFAENQLDDALRELEQISESEYQEYQAEKNELSGDIHAAKGDHQLARNAYQKAQEGGALGARGSLLQLKLDALPAAP